MTDNRMVKRAELWQRKNAKGTVYFSGFMGACQVLMFKDGEKPHPTRPDETVIVWRLFVQEARPERRPPAKQPQGQRGAGQAAVDAAEPFDDSVDHVGRGR